MPVLFLGLGRHAFDLDHAAPDSTIGKPAGATPSRARLAVDSQGVPAVVPRRLDRDVDRRCRSSSRRRSPTSSASGRRFSRGRSACALWTGLAMISNNWLWCAERSRLATSGSSLGLGARTSASTSVLLPRYGLQRRRHGSASSKLLSLTVLLGTMCRMLHMHVDRRPDARVAPAGPADARSLVAHWVSSSSPRASCRRSAFQRRRTSNAAAAGRRCVPLGKAARRLTFGRQCVLERRTAKCIPIYAPSSGCVTSSRSACSNNRGASAATSRRGIERVAEDRMPERLPYESAADASGR